MVVEALGAGWSGAEVEGAEVVAAVVEVASVVEVMALMVVGAADDGGLA